MQTKIVVIGVVAVGATALGSILIIRGQGTDSSAGVNAGLLADAGTQAVGVDPYQPIAVEEVERRVPGEKKSSGNSGTGDWMDFAARMSQFDGDGDGFLSDEEKKAMRESMRDEWMAKMDLDGDGEISREERMAARQARFENSDRGQALMRRFDADGDGVLNDEEQAAMDAYNEQQREAKRQAQIDRYDTDGDGELSREERQVQRDEQRAQWDTLKERAQQEFDSDGDGQLNIEEQQDAINAWRERQEIDRFINQYDSDGDGVMGASDYQSFVSDYGNGDLGADVNHDGNVDTLDLAAYRDLVVRSNNP